MKVLVAHFTAESNAHVKKLTEFQDFVYKTGNEMLQAMHIQDIFEDANIELIPTIYANGHSGGRVSKEAFQFIAKEILKKVSIYQNDIDGIYLFLHGASNVVDLEGGAGEHYILREIRKIVGEYLPIAVVMDPHGNLSQELVDHANILRCYRHSPHTDIAETYRKVASMFIDLLKKRRHIQPTYRKLPLMLGGERCVSTDEPMVSINKLLDEVEKSNRIMSASYHIGYLRHDSPYCGASVVVVPNELEDTIYANEIANQIEKFVMEKRHDFHYTGVTMDVEEAIENVLKHSGKLAFMSDSGDNTTSGSSGYNTDLLSRFLKQKETIQKKVLFAAITDPIASVELEKAQLNDRVEFMLGMNENKFSKPIKMIGQVTSKGCVHNVHHETENIGSAITIKIENTSISIIVSSRSITYSEIQQFDAANITIDDYEVIVVKQGYLFPELKEIATFGVMALTEGATDQRTERLKYKKIMRPMFPIDQF